MSNETRAAFERHNPVPFDCYWNEERQMYCHKAYPQTRHGFDAEWTTWAEACAWKDEQATDAPESDDKFASEKLSVQFCSTRGYEGEDESIAVDAFCTGYGIGKKSANGEQAAPVAVPDGWAEQKPVVVEVLRQAAINEQDIDCCWGSEKSPALAEAVSWLADALDADMLNAAPPAPAVDEQELIAVEVKPPPEGIAVIGFHDDWVHGDFNENGTRECHRYGDGTEWMNACWSNDGDCWVVDEQAPTHWCHFPSTARLRAQQQGGGQS